MYYTKHVTLTDTTETTMFAIPNGYTCYVTFVFAANHGGSTNSVDVKWTDNEPVPNDLMYIFDGTTINSGNNTTLGGQSDAPIFVLHAGEVVKAQATSAGNIEVAVTFRLVEQSPSLINFNGS